MLSPESKQSDFCNSIKKYFLEKVEIDLGIKVFFDWIADIPKGETGEDLTKWVIVEFGVLDLGNVASCIVNLYLFTIKDFENYEMNLFTDKILNIFINEESTNGLHTIDYFDTAPAFMTVEVLSTAGMSVGDLVTEIGVPVGSTVETVVDGTHVIVRLPWTKVGGIIPFIKKIFEPVEAKNNAKIKTINLLCKWGGK